MLSNTERGTSFFDLSALERDFRKGNVVVVCGAGISLDPPTSLPSGREIRNQFLELINRSFERARQWHPSLSGTTFPSKALPRMPERVLEPFYNLFADRVFAFLDPFFLAKPNHNHRNLAKLAEGGFLKHVITLNFDFALESSLRGYRVFTSFEDFRKKGVRGSTLAVHKPHGTLRLEDADKSSSIKYRGILCTVQRIGTALNEPLVSWFREVIGDCSLLVTGYSADDLDVFPALQLALGQGHVYWNSKDEPSDITDVWLRSLSNKCTKLTDDIDSVLGPIVESLCPPKATREHGSRNPVSLGHISDSMDDTARVLLASALICHNSEAREYANLRDLLIKCLEEPLLLNAFAADSNEALQLKLLEAGRAHEQGTPEIALRNYRFIRSSIRKARRSGEWFSEELRQEVESLIAYETAWPLKRRETFRMSHMYGRLKIIGGLFRLLWRAHVPILGIPRSARALSAHFFGEFPLTLGLRLDLGAPANPITRILYRIAHWHFRLATAPHRGFVTRDVFHQMRRDEAKMNLLRSRWLLKPSMTELRRIDTHITHYRYLNGKPADSANIKEDLDLVESQGVMEGDASRGVHLILEAMRASIDEKPILVRRRIDQAWQVFREARSGSGLHRVQMYEWILHAKRIQWRKALLDARRKRRHVTELRTWYKGSPKSEPCFEKDAGSVK